MFRVHIFVMNRFKDMQEMNGSLMYRNVVIGSDRKLNPAGYIDVYVGKLAIGRVFNPAKHYLFPIPLTEYH